MLHYEGDERRRYPRSHRAFHGIEDQAGPGVLNHVDNISSSGVSCHTVKPVPLMTRMSVVVELPKLDVESSSLFARSWRLPDERSSREPTFFGGAPQPFSCGFFMHGASALR